MCPVIGGQPVILLSEIFRKHIYQAQEQNKHALDISAALSYAPCQFWSWISGLFCLLVPGEENNLAKKLMQKKEKIFVKVVTKPRVPPFKSPPNIFWWLEVSDASPDSQLIISDYTTN